MTSANSHSSDSSNRIEMIDTTTDSTSWGESVSGQDSSIDGTGHLDQISLEEVTSWCPDSDREESLNINAQQNVSNAHRPKCIESYFDKLYEKIEAMHSISLKLVRDITDAGQENCNKCFTNASKNAEQFEAVVLSQILSIRNDLEENARDVSAQFIEFDMKMVETLANMQTQIEEQITLKCAKIMQCSSAKSKVMEQSSDQLLTSLTAKFDTVLKRLEILDLIQPASIGKYDADCLAKICQSSERTADILDLMEGCYASASQKNDVECDRHQVMVEKLRGSKDRLASHEKMQRIQWALSNFKLALPFEYRNQNDIIYDGHELISNILFSFNKGLGFRLRERKSKINGSTSEFRDELVDVLHKLLGVKPRIGSSMSGTGYTINYP